MTAVTGFPEWIRTFVGEKDLDMEYTFEVEGDRWGTNFIPLGCVVDAAIAGTAEEQRMIQTTLVHLDFRAGDPMSYFAHLAAAMAL